MPQGETAATPTPVGVPQYAPGTGQYGKISETEMKRILPLSAFLILSVSAGGAVHTAAALRDAVYGNFIQTEFTVTGRVNFVRLDGFGRPNAIAAEDGTGGIIMFSNAEAAWDGVPKPGDLAVFSGRTELDQGKKPCAYIEKHVFIAPGVPAEPVDVTAGDIISGVRDFQRTRFSGILRDATGSETNPNWTMLVVHDGHSRVFASVPTAGRESETLKKSIGERVRLTGCSVPDDLSPRLRIGRVFLVSGTGDVQSLTAETENAENLPDAGGIQYGSLSGAETLGPHRVSGGVVAVCRNRRTVIRTLDGDFVGAEFPNGPMPGYGETVTAWGLPESDLFHLHLTNARWKKTDGVFKEEAPVSIDPRRLFTNRHGAPEMNSRLHGHPVRFTGVVRSRAGENAANRLLHIESDGALVTVDATSLPEDIQNFPIGSRVAVTGTCVIEMETPRSTSSFPKIGRISVVPRKPADIAVISYPPWWTPARLCGVIGALFAALVAIFIWNITLRKAAVRKGRELMCAELGQIKAAMKTEERTRLAVELHDSVAQMITGISMEIEAAKGMGTAAEREMMEHIDIAGKALKSCRDELRNCLWDLRSQALEENDFGKAIMRTLQPHVSDTRIDIDFAVPRISLSDNTAHALLRIIRELVTNAVRHGKATHILITGKFDGENIACTVRDDGRGFNPDACPGVFQGHFGLAGIRERVSRLRGKISIAGGPGTGSEFHLSIPKAANFQ